LGGGVLSLAGLKDRIISDINTSFPNIKVVVANEERTERSVYVGLTFAPEALPEYET
jgi:hypothetical protein